MRKLTPEDLERVPPGLAKPGIIRTLREVINPHRVVVEKVVQCLEYGDVASWWIGPELVVQLTAPDTVKEVFVDNYGSLRRANWDIMRAVLGNGLLTANPPEHMEHRVLMMPEFRRHRVALYCEAMAACVDDHVSGWQDGQRVEFLTAMSTLGTDITAKTLFGMDSTVRSKQMAEDYDFLAAYVFERQMAHPKLRQFIHKLPLPRNREFRRAVGRFDELIYGFIKERRESQRLNDDFMTVMIQQSQYPDEEIDIYAMMARQDLGLNNALPAQTASGNGQCPVTDPFLTDKQLRDEAMTLLLAGQESFHSVMSWIMHYLSLNQGLQDRLHQEVDEVLEGRLPDIADFPRLDLVENIALEGLRIRPPVLAFGRVAARDFTVKGYLVPRGATVFTPVTVIHHQPDIYPDPDEFNPDRWTPAFRENLPRFNFVPFGIGAHKCIGEQFALMQMRLNMVRIEQRWRVHPDPSHKLEVPTGYFNLPRGGIPIYLESRK